LDVVFLDANVLFSAAYRADAGVRRLWRVKRGNLITSAYAVEEAYRNLDEAAQRERLQALLRSVRVVPEARDRRLPNTVQLPEKDRPILLAAIAAGATHLITGDVTHFGPYLGRAVEGVLILRPAQYLARRSPDR